MSVRHRELPGLPQLRQGRTGARPPIYSPGARSSPRPRLSGLSRAHTPPPPNTSLGAQSLVRASPSLEVISALLLLLPAHPPLNFFSLRRRSCKCFIAASSCFLWKPGVPACTDPVSGAAWPFCFVFMGTSLRAQRVPLPSLGGLWGQWPCSPLGGALCPQS